MAEENQVAEQQQTPSEPVTQEVNWRESLPEDLRDDPSLKSIKDISGLAKSFVHSQKMIGMDKIPVPTEHATQEDWDVVYSKLGRPENPDAYEIEGEATEMITDFKPLAHRLGLNQNQVKELVEFYNTKQSDALQTAQVDGEQHRAEIESTLRKEYGRAYDNKINAAMRLAKNVFTTEQLDNIKLADGTTLGNNIDLIKGFVQLADRIGEDKPISNPQENLLTPQEAREKMEKLMAPGSPYWNKTHPNHDKAVADVMELREMAVNE